MKTQRRSRFTHPLQALSAEFSIIVWFAAVIAQGENTKTKPIHAPSSGFPVSEFGIIIWFADVRAHVWLKSAQTKYSYGTSKVSCFSWRHKTILVAARPETWQFSQRELHCSLLDEKQSILAWERLNWPHSIFPDIKSYFIDFIAKYLWTFYPLLLRISQNVPSQLYPGQIILSLSHVGLRPALA